MTVPSGDYPVSRVGQWFCRCGCNGHGFGVSKMLGVKNVLIINGGEEYILYN